MIYRVYYEGKTEKINIAIPLTYEKLVTAISEQYGLPPDQQQLLVNNVQLTNETNFDKCKLPMYPIVVRKLTNINVLIGKISFSTSFFFGYKCSVLCTFILNILSSYGFTIPEFDYYLDIDGKPVNMEGTVEKAGAVENSTVTLLSRSGESLDLYFHLDAEEEEEGDEGAYQQQQEEEVEQPVEQPAEQQVPENNQEEEDLPAEIPQEDQPAEKPAEPANDDNLVTVHRRVGKENRRVASPSSSVNPQLEKPTELPENVRALLATLRSPEKQQEEKNKAVAEIEGILFNCQSNLYDNGIQLSVYDNMVTEINYENQMLRDMYNSVNPQAPMTKEIEEKQKGSWQRAVRLDDGTITVLPDNVEELKKLVNEKYATALMNERRYEKEHKRCKKWKLVAQSLGVNDENVDAYVTEFHGVVEHRDHLKDENLDLKGQIRQLNSEIDSRDDEIRRLTETVHCRDNTIEELVLKVQQYDAFIKEAGIDVNKNEMLTGKVEVKEERKMLTEEEEEKMEEEKRKMEEEMKKVEEEKRKMEEEMKKVEEEKRKMEVEKKGVENEKKSLEGEKRKMESEKKKMEEEKKSMEGEKKKMEEEKRKMESEKKKMEEEKRKMEGERKEFILEQKALEEVTEKMDEEYKKLEEGKKTLSQQQDRINEELEEIEKERRELEARKNKQEEEQLQLEEKEKKINELEASISEMQEKVNSCLSPAEQEELVQQTQLLSTENTELKNTISSMVEENEKNLNEQSEYILELTQLLEKMNNGLKAKKDRTKSLQEE